MCNYIKLLPKPPKPGNQCYNRTRLFPIACNEVSLCHPYAQCVYIPSTGDFECRCNPEYDGDGIECVKRGTQSNYCHRGGWDKIAKNRLMESEKFILIFIENVMKLWAQPPGPTSFSPRQAAVFAEIDQPVRFFCLSTNKRRKKNIFQTEVSCLDVDICDPNASCRSDEVPASCVCNPGYVGDGTICNPIGAFISSTSLLFQNNQNLFIINNQYRTIIESQQKSSRPSRFTENQK